MTRFKSDKYVLYQAASSTINIGHPHEGIQTLARDARFRHNYAAMRSSETAEKVANHYGLRAVSSELPGGTVGGGDAQFSPETWDSGQGAWAGTRVVWGSIERPVLILRYTTDCMAAGLQRFIDEHAKFKHAYDKHDVPGVCIMIPGRDRTEKAPVPGLQSQVVTGTVLLPSRHP